MPSRAAGAQGAAVELDRPTKATLEPSAALEQLRELLAPECGDEPEATEPSP